MSTREPPISGSVKSGGMSDRHGISFALVSLCFFLSGVAGLIYQMVWMRTLATVFGTSELAIVAVLVAYMGGLAAGAWIASRKVHSLRRPVRVYALLELAIALSALAVPLLLPLAGRLQAALLGGQEVLPSDGGAVDALARLALGTVVLLVPTACMGATLPILAKGVVHRSAQIGTRIGWLYALNTFGAVAGTLVAAFVLIPRLGLWGTSFAGVGVNAVVALLGWWAAKGFAVAPEARASDPEPAIQPVAVRPFLILAVMGASGALAFMYEILWSRLLSHVLGSSFHAFAIMLAAFLAGIALGGMLGARLARDARRACFWLAGAELGTGLLTAGLFAFVGAGGLGGGDPSPAGLAALCALVLLPATLCLGATFPLAVRCLGDAAADAGRAAGRVYAWNTVGAIVGAVAAGLFLIPALGYAGTFRWAVTGNLMLGAVVFLALRERPRIPLALAVVVCLLAVFWYHPAAPVALLTRSPMDEGGGAERGQRLIHLATGRSATVAVLERRGSFVIRSNGLPEAEIFPRGAEALSYTHIRWLPALPKVLAPEAESLLVVGFGGGALLEVVPPGYRDVDVVEIEEEVIAANRVIAARRAIDPLRDERLNIVINDARGALQLTAKRYDVIVSQPSHPWTAGASHLYTREFLALAGEHLNPGGILVQWLGASFVDEALFRSFCATGLAVFPHVQVYLIGDNFLLLGSDEGLDARLFGGGMGDLFPLSGYPKLSYREDLLAVLQLDEAGCRDIAEGHRPITDDRNLMATPRVAHAGGAAGLNRPENLKRVLAPRHYLNRDPSGVRMRLDAAGVDFTYLTRLLGTASPALDRDHYYREILTEGDRLMLKARALLGRQPDEAASLLQTAVLQGVDEKVARPVEALARLSSSLQSWSSRKGTPPPREFADFLRENEALARTVPELTPLQQTVMEARYWSATKQLDRVGEVDSELARMTDHRAVWFESAYESRLLHLTDPGGKTPEEIRSDGEVALALLDRLLALPIERNLPLLSQRIALAQALGDEEYLISVGWTLARKLLLLPPGGAAEARAVYGDLLGSLFTPYASRSVHGTVVLSRPRMAAFHLELVDEIGASAIRWPSEG